MSQGWDRILSGSRCLHETQTSQPMGLRFPHRWGGIDPQDYRFHPQFVGVADVRK